MDVQQVVLLCNKINLDIGLTKAGGRSLAVQMSSVPLNMIKDHGSWEVQDQVVMIGPYKVGMFGRAWNGLSLVTLCEMMSRFSHAV